MLAFYYTIELKIIKSLSCYIFLKKSNVSTVKTKKKKKRNLKDKMLLRKISARSSFWTEQL